MNPFCHAVSVPAPRATLIGYLSDLNNLPEWATGFCQKLTVTEHGFIVTTPMGDMAIRAESHAPSGTLDLITTVDGMDDTLYTRVTPLPGGDSAWTVTFHQGHGLTDEMFAGQCQSLQDEMATVARLFETSAVAG